MKNFSQYDDERFIKEWKEYHGNFMHYWIKMILPLYLAVAVLVRIVIYGFHDLLGLSFLVYIFLFIGMATVVGFHFNYKKHVKRYEDLKEEGKAE